MDFRNREEAMQWSLTHGSIGFNDEISRESLNPESEGYRLEYIKNYQAYYDASQYNDKPAHDFEGIKPGTHSTEMPQGRPYLFKEKKPAILDNIPRLMVNRTFAMLLGADRFPNVKVDEEAIEKQLNERLRTSSLLKQQFCVAARKMLACGTCIIHNTLFKGQFKPKVYDARYSRPVFNKINPYLLDSVTIIWDFWQKDETRKSDKEPMYKRFWGRLDIDDTKEVMFAPIEYQQGSFCPPPNDNPIWKVSGTLEHNIGFCPCVWVRNTLDIDAESIDGKSLYHGELGNFDAVNYATSMHDKALLYSGSPQTIISGIEEHQLARLKGGPNRTWVLPQEGKAEYLEIQGKGIERLLTHIKHLKRIIGQNTRVVIDDPEEIQGWAVSTSAIQMHFQPMYDLIDELRSVIAPFLLIYLKQYLLMISGKRANIENVAGEKSIPLKLDWKKMQLETPEELEKIMVTLATAAGSNILSAETRTKVAARHFPIDDVSAELSLIEKEKKATEDMKMKQQMNRPFGATQSSPQK